MFVVLYIPEFLGFSLWLTYPERMNLILAVALAMFAAIEAYSTFLQVILQDKKNMMEDKKNMIDDARNELEKAYGPLFTILNKYEFGNKEKQEFFDLNDNEKAQVDAIMATYPFMFPLDINDLWKKMNQKPKAYMNASTGAMLYYEIPTEFRDKINKEYDYRVKKYNQLVRKEEK